MFKKIKNSFYLIFIFTFSFFIIKHYFSESNVIFVNKSKSSYQSEIIENITNLPLLKNDTKDIIVNNIDIDEYKKQRKKRFWENLISNNDE